MHTVEELLNNLKRSKFRSSFSLTGDEIRYCREKGYDVIKKHAYDFINEKLRPAQPYNDGKQTPMKGHPVFKAMHACACCCRDCLNKWYHVPKNVELCEADCDKIVSLIMAWVGDQIRKNGHSNCQGS